jgi:transcriptional regulator with XRE-family HTH domain
MLQQEATPVHEGRNVRRLREVMGIKQETLAIQLGMTQQGISNIEQREELGRETLEKVAKAMGVTPDAIRNYDEDLAMNVINNSFTSHDNSTLNAVNHKCNQSSNYVYKEILERNEKLYERLIKSLEEKVELLERMINK